eukprot:g13.t1
MNATISIQQVKLRCYTSDPTSTYQIRLFRRDPEWMLKLETENRPRGEAALDVTWGSLAGEALDSFTYVSLRRLLDGILDVELWKTGVGSPRKAGRGQRQEASATANKRDDIVTIKRPVSATMATALPFSTGMGTRKTSAKDIAPPAAPTRVVGAAVPSTGGGATSSSATIDGGENDALQFVAGSPRSTHFATSAYGLLKDGNDQANSPRSSSAERAGVHLPTSTVATGGEAPWPGQTPISLQHLHVLADQWKLSKLALLKVVAFICAYELTRFVLRIETDDFVGQLIVKLCWHWLQVELPTSKLHEERKKQHVPPKIRAQRCTDDSAKKKPEPNMPEEYRREYIARPVVRVDGRPGSANSTTAFDQPLSPRRRMKEEAGYRPRRAEPVEDFKFRKQQQKQDALSLLRKGVIQLRLDLEKMHPVVPRTTAFPFPGAVAGDVTVPRGENAPPIVPAD